MPRPSWIDGGYLYLTVGLLQDYRVGAGRVVEVPRATSGVGELLGLELVRADGLRDDGSGGWRATGSTYVSLAVNASEHSYARLGSTLATSLGVGNGGAIRLRAPTRRELVRERATEAAAAAASGVAALGSFVAGVIEVESGGAARKLAIASLAVAFAASAGLSVFLLRRVFRNRRG